jgi:hypothetical protein
VRCEKGGVRMRNEGTREGRKGRGERGEGEQGKRKRGKEDREREVGVYVLWEAKLTMSDDTALIMSAIGSWVRFS